MKVAGQGAIGFLDRLAVGVGRDTENLRVATTQPALHVEDAALHLDVDVETLVDLVFIDLTGSGRSFLGLREDARLRLCTAELDPDCRRCPLFLDSVAMLP